MNWNSQPELRQYTQWHLHFCWKPVTVEIVEHHYIIGRKRVWLAWVERRIAGPNSGWKRSWWHGNMLDPSRTSFQYRDIDYERLQSISAL